MIESKEYHNTEAIGVTYGPQEGYWLRIGPEGGSETYRSFIQDTAFKDVMNGDEGSRQSKLEALDYLIFPSLRKNNIDPSQLHTAFDTVKQKETAEFEEFIKSMNQE